MASPRREFTPAEKQMVVKSHTFFTLQKKLGNFKGSRTNQLVAESTGCSPAVVQRVMKQFRADPTTNFAVSLAIFVFN
jgi:hypothetical protein